MNILLDAGPALNFLAVGQENILIQLAASHQLQLTAPGKVDAEVFGMSKNSSFADRPVLAIWNRLKMSGRIRILDDYLTLTQFAATVTRISGMPAQQRMRSSRDLGEILVIGHASVAVQERHHAYVLMDESDGRRRVLRNGSGCRDQNLTGALTLWSTPNVLAHAGQQTGWITNDLTWEQVYKAMMSFDDGLPAL